LQPRGNVYDLAEIQRELSQRYFSGAVQLDITWGRHGSTRRKHRSRRTIRMGTYFIDEQLIRIHPALDQNFVPRYFVEWVVYHEMLHHVVPMPVVNGRRIYHSTEFRTRERQYADFERARAWEDAHLRKLIGSRRVAATT
jgi:predicted SprT family Zn-dependent metalloprotease